MCRSYKTSNSFLSRSKYPEIVEYLETECDNQSDFIRDAIIYYWEHSFKDKVERKLTSHQNQPEKIPEKAISLADSEEVIPSNDSSDTKEDMDYLLGDL